MNADLRTWPAVVLFTACGLATPPSAMAQSPQILAADATRYMAIGDSIASGYKAMPVTDGYTYRLYNTGVFDTVPHTLFCNAAVPGATSSDVLLHQVPQAVIPFAAGGFNPAYVTLTVGGNDLLAILRFMQTHQDPVEVMAFATAALTTYGQNLGAALFQLRSALPGAKIFVANQYTIPEINAIVPLAAPLVMAFNNTVQQVVDQFPTNVYLVDVYSAFLGRNSLLLIERNGASVFETHLTSVGHRVMEKAFADVIDQNK
jgi:lysophospholipase L1-like esterase